MKYRVNLKKTDEGFFRVGTRSARMLVARKIRGERSRECKGCHRILLGGERRLERGTRKSGTWKWHMPKLPGVNHLRAVKAFERAGFWIARQKKHITMTDGEELLPSPERIRWIAYTMVGIIRDAGLTVEAFKNLL